MTAFMHQCPIALPSFTVHDTSAASHPRSLIVAVAVWLWLWLQQWLRWACGCCSGCGCGSMPKVEWPARCAAVALHGARVHARAQAMVEKYEAHKHCPRCAQFVSGKHNVFELLLFQMSSGAGIRGAPHTVREHPFAPAHTHALS